MNFAYLFFAAGIFAALLALGTLIRAEFSISRWAFIAGMAVLAAESVLNGFSLRADGIVGLLEWQTWRLCLSVLLPAPWLLFSFTYARGSGGDLWRGAQRFLFPVFLLLACLAVYFRQSLVEPLAQADGSTFFRFRWPAVTLNLVILASCIIILMQLERTFRASIGTMRWRIKFMLLGAGALFLVRLYTTTQALLFRVLDMTQQSLNAATLIVACLLILRTLLRTGHFTLDVYPSRSVLQHSLTLVISGVYLLVVGLFAKVVAYVGGDSAFALKAFLTLLSLVFLAVLAQSDRVRLQLRRFISRNFQRPIFDYRTAWMKFSEGTASRIEQADLSRTVVRLVAEMFDLLSASLWLVDEKKHAFTLSASTSLSSDRSDVPGNDPEAVRKVADYFQENPNPVDLDSSTDASAAWLRDLHPLEFATGGHRIGVPMIARGELIGVLILGDRVAGQPFTLQDFDMLKCVGDHAAGTLLNAQFSRKLVEAKEVEAFQTMATFFVHDLKNAASTLHLTLQNLPVHFNDPEFREDALRGMAKSVGHINRLVQRLGHLRKELALQPKSVDLQQVVEESLANLDPGDGISLVKKYGELPRISADLEQLSKVLVNLVINAREAMSGSGVITVETRQEGNWAVVGVADTGCGMTPEFLRSSLFRPFQTTKPAGLGIGMFQSKMIVEGHGGRLAASSEVGKGTRFTVYLPIHEKGKFLSEDQPMEMKTQL